jgi:hypothetical protein
MDSGIQVHYQEGRIPSCKIGVKGSGSFRLFEELEALSPARQGRGSTRRGRTPGSPLPGSALEPSRRALRMEEEQQAAAGGLGMVDEWPVDAV